MDWREVNWRRKEGRKQSRLMVRVFLTACYYHFFFFWLKLFEVRLLVTGQMWFIRIRLRLFIIK